MIEKKKRFNSRVFKFSWLIEIIADEYYIKLELWEKINKVSYLVSVDSIFRSSLPAAREEFIREIRLDIYIFFFKR